LVKYQKTSLKNNNLFISFQVCVDTLCKYVDNILENPTDDKFRKIRKSNKAYAERVAGVEGHDLFLDALGFETETVDGQVRFWSTREREERNR
jgi:hypothetical protein